jgi:hypothetical protein
MLEEEDLGADEFLDVLQDLGKLISHNLEISIYLWYLGHVNASLFDKHLSGLPCVSLECTMLISETDLRGKYTRLNYGNGQILISYDIISV